MSNNKVIGGRSVGNVKQVLPVVDNNFVAAEQFSAQFSTYLEPGVDFEQYDEQVFVVATDFP